MPLRCESFAKAWKAGFLHECAQRPVFPRKTTRFAQRGVGHSGNCVRVCLKLTEQEGVGVIPAQPLFGQDVARKILGVHSDDAVCMAMNSGGKHMDVMWIGKPQARFQSRVNGNRSLGKSGLHHGDLAARDRLALRPEFAGGERPLLKNARGKTAT